MRCPGTGVAASWDGWTWRAPEILRPAHIPTRSTGEEKGTSHYSLEANARPLLNNRAGGGWEVIYARARTPLSKSCHIRWFSRRGLVSHLGCLRQLFFLVGLFRTVFEHVGVCPGLVRNFSSELRQRYLCGEVSWAGSGRHAADPREERIIVTLFVVVCTGDAMSSILAFQTQISREYVRSRINARRMRAMGNWSLCLCGGQARSTSKYFT